MSQPEWEELLQLLDALLEDHGETIAYYDICENFDILPATAKQILYTYSEFRKDKIEPIYFLSVEDNTNGCVTRRHRLMSRDEATNLSRDKSSDSTNMYVHSVKLKNHNYNSHILWQKEMQKCNRLIVKRLEENATFTPKQSEIELNPDERIFMARSEKKETKITPNVANNDDKLTPFLTPEAPMSDASCLNTQEFRSVISVNTENMCSNLQRERFEPSNLKKRLQFSSSDEPSILINSGDSTIQTQSKKPDSKEVQEATPMNKLKGNPKKANPKKKRCIASPTDDVRTADYPKDEKHELSLSLKSLDDKDGTERTEAINTSVKEESLTQKFKNKNYMTLGVLKECDSPELGRRQSRNDQSNEALEKKNVNALNNGKPPAPKQSTQSKVVLQGSASKRQSKSSQQPSITTFFQR